MGSFISGNWQNQIDVRDFVSKNISPYDGDSSFLGGPSATTKKLWQICVDAIKEERENNGVRGIALMPAPWLIPCDCLHARRVFV